MMKITLMSAIASFILMIAGVGNIYMNLNDSVLRNNLENGGFLKSQSLSKK